MQPADGERLTDEQWRSVRAEAFQRVSDFFRETADTKPTWTAIEASEQWAMYAKSLRERAALRVPDAQTEGK